MGNCHDSVIEFYDQLGYPHRALPLMEGEELPPNAQTVYNLALEVLLSERCQELRNARQASYKVKGATIVPDYWEETNGLLDILSHSKLDIYSFSTMFRYCRAGILQDPFTVGFLMRKAGVDIVSLSGKQNQNWEKLEDFLSNIDYYWDEIFEFNGFKSK